MKPSIGIPMACLALAASALAQTAAAPDAATLARYDTNRNGRIDPEEQAAMDADKAVVLSSFEVRTDRDRGYQAIDAGSGGRVDLPFKLVPSAMSAITKEFMEDWAITDMRDSFRYAMNVDIANSSAPNNTPFGEFQFNFRGVGDSGNYPTRNYFLYYGNSDSYNTERFEFARGPNSVLFGDGQIGGIATTMTKRPLPRDAYQLSARYDSWGGFRGTFDANKVISAKQALRVNGLYVRNAYGPAWRDNARSDDKAIDFAWGYKFTDRTSLRTEAEWGRLKRMTFATNYSDSVQYYNGSYVFDGTNALPTLGAAPNALNQTTAGASPVNAGNPQYTVIPSAPSLGLVNVGNGNFWRSSGTGFALRPDYRSDLPGLQTPFKLPSREFNLGPNDSLGRYKFQVYSFYLDHKFTDDISGQLSFYDYNNDRNSRETAFANNLAIDVTKLLPGGAANPNVGKVYADVQPARQYQENYVYEWRGLVTWKTRLPWHGRGQFSAIAGERNERFEARSLISARVDGPNPIWTAAENQIRYRYYLADAGRYGGAELPADRPGFTYRYVPNGFASVEHKDIRYLQAVAATGFLDDRVTLLLGARNDDLIDDQYGNIASSAPGTPAALDSHGLQRHGGFVPGVGVVVGAHNLTKASAFTYNYGGTVWVDPKKTIGLVYNYSKNFAPPTSGAAKIIGFAPDGTFIGTAFGATTGNDRSYGVRLSLLDDTISAEARRYDGTQIDRIDGGGVQGSFRTIWANSGPFYANNSSLTQQDWRDVGALKAQGYEFQVTANVKGLRLTANYSLPKTKSLNVRPGSLAYATQFLPVVQKFAATGRNDKGEALTSSEINTLNAQVLAVQNNLAGSAPGTVNNGTYRWMGSLAATYQFARESALSGFSVGFGLSGRGPRKVTSVNPNILFNLPNGATATPAQNGAAAFAYLYTPSYWTEDMNLAYRRRIGRYNTRFQLNVTNLTDRKDLIYTTYATYRALGAASNPLLGMFPNGYTWLDPRKFVFSTTIDFAGSGRTLF